MTNSTPEYWDIDGESLQTYAWNITSWGGDREAPPPLRGADIQIPGMAGKLFLPKIEDSRSITLSMWVQGSNDDGTMPSGGSARALFEYNWKNLRRLLWTPRRQRQITKRFLPYGASTYVAAVGKGQCSAGLNPTMNGRQHAAFTADISMTDPYFYAPQKSLPIINAGQSGTFSYLGDGRTNRIMIEMDGALAAGAFVQNVSPDDEMHVEYLNALNSGDVLKLDVKNFSSNYTPSGAAGYGVNGNIAHVGDAFWLAFDPGANTVTLSAAGSGSAKITYQEAYL